MFGLDNKIGIVLVEQQTVMKSSIQIPTRVCKLSSSHSCPTAPHVRSYYFSLHPSVGVVLSHRELLHSELYPPPMTDYFLM